MPVLVTAILGLITLAVIIGCVYELTRSRLAARPTRSADTSVLVDYYRDGDRYSSTRTGADALTDPSLLAAAFRAELIAKFGKSNLGPTLFEWLNDGGVIARVAVSSKDEVIAFKMELVTDPALKNN